MSALEDALDAFDRWVDDGAVKGVGAAVWRGDGIVATRCAGEGSPGRPVSADTVFALASVSKPFTAAAVMFVLIGVGMSCGLGAFQVAACATGFLGAVLIVLDLTAQPRPNWVKLSLDVENLREALPPLRALHPEARMLTLEQEAPTTQAGTAVFELAMPPRMDGLQLLEGLRTALPGVRSASIDPS